MRNLFATIALGVFISACSSQDYSQGAVTAVELEPRDPIAGQPVRVLVDLYDQTLYPGTEVARPYVEVSVTGGQLEGQSYGENAKEWVIESGADLTVSNRRGIFWTLPTEPGTYKLTVTFGDSSKTKRVVIH
jgi:hypothetical protein